jgi:hypothetical protein
MKVVGEIKNVLNETCALETSTGSVNICVSDSCSLWSGTGVCKCGGQVAQEKTFVRRLPVFVGPQYGPCFMSPF